MLNHMYLNHGDTIMISAPGADDVRVNVYQTEYERREAMMRGGHKADGLENALSQGLLLFHGPAAREMQLEEVKRLCKLAKQDRMHMTQRDAAISRLGEMIVEGENAYHA